MIVYVAVQWFADYGTEPEVLGVYSSLEDAKHEVEGYYDWDPEYCDKEALFWGNEDYSVQIFDREVE